MNYSLLRTRLKERGFGGFTLIELLVVVAIIALLIALLLPQLAKAREQAKMVKCGANLHAIAICSNTYSAGNNGLIVEGSAFYRPDIAVVPPASPTNGPALLSFAECFAIDGDVQQQFDNYDNSIGTGHFPLLTRPHSIFVCPSTDPTVQYGQSGGGYNGYGLSYYARSHFQNTCCYPYNPNNPTCPTVDGKIPNLDPFGNQITPGQGGETTATRALINASSLNPNKIFAFDGYYTPGTGPGAKNAAPGGVWQYWVYPRHLCKDTYSGPSGVAASFYATRYDGFANYLFCDGHVEPSQTYLADTIYNYPSSGFDRSPWYQQPQ